MKRISRVLICGAAAVAVVCASAQEEDSMTDESSEEPAEEVVAGAKTKQAAQPEKFYFALPMCRLLDGQAEVIKPGASAWQPIEEGRFYPLGCSYRTIGAATRLTIQFGAASEVNIEGEASFGTVAQPLGVKTRTIILKSGTITLK